MMIESRTIVGASAALAIVGAMLWGSAALMTPAPVSKQAQVEVKQVEDRSWSVEIKDVGFQPAAETQKTASVAR